jgi:hypothetical protein
MGSAIKLPLLFWSVRRRVIWQAAFRVVLQDHRVLLHHFTVSLSTMDAIRQDLENLREIIGQGPGWQQRLRDALDPSFYLKALLLANPATLPFRMPVAQARD